MLVSRGLCHWLELSVQPVDAFGPLPVGFSADVWGVEHASCFHGSSRAHFRFFKVSHGLDSAEQWFQQMQSESGCLSADLERRRHVTAKMAMCRTSLR